MPEPTEVDALHIEMMDRLSLETELARGIDARNLNQAFRIITEIMNRDNCRSADSIHVFALANRIAETSLVNCHLADSGELRFCAPLSS